MIKNGMRLIHPGEILQEDYLTPLNISTDTLAKQIGVPNIYIDEIITGNRKICSDIAARLASYLGGDAQSWLNLQISYDLKKVEKNQT